MRYLFIFSVLWSFIFNSNGQNSIVKNAVQQRLFNDLRKYDRVESRCLGFACAVSEVYLKADSLFAISSLDDVLVYFNGSSYIVKYYAFTRMVELNDSIAFVRLEESINDSTDIFCHFNCVIGGEKYNELLVMAYWNFVEMKYAYGGEVSMGGKIYHFGKKNKRAWHVKKRQLKKLLKSNRIDGARLGID